MDSFNELPIRKINRLKNYNYSRNGTYFVTICTKNREKMLCEISVGDGVLDVPKIKLSEYGIIADKYINDMNNFYDYISVDKYVIMPNHVHLIIRILNNVKVGIHGTSRTPSPTNSIIAQFVSTFKRFCNKEYGENIWQRSFHDHIIRNEDDYFQISNYIDTNPVNWDEDCFCI